MTDNANLQPVLQKFFEYDLDTAAHILESMTEEEAAEVLKSLPMTLSVRVVKVLQISYAAALLKDADDGFLREMTSHLDPQSATSILMRLPQEARERMTRHISEKLKGQIRELLEYPEGSIGRTAGRKRRLKKSVHWPKGGSRHRMYTSLMRITGLSAF